MILRSVILLAGTTILLSAAPALAQQTLTENINNTGIPRNAPSLGLANIYGLNPCSSGMAVGVTTPLFGIGGAVANIDKECETRNNAAVVITALKDEPMAREILCQIKDIREAAKRIGQPCLEDQSQQKVSSAAPANPTPTAAPASEAKPTQPMAGAEAPTMVTAARPILADSPAYCHVSGLDLRVYPECTTVQGLVVPPVVTEGRPLPAAQAPAVPATSVKRPGPPTNEQRPTWSRPGATTAPTEKRTPEDSAKELKNPSQATSASYTPSRTGGKPARMIERAVATSVAPPLAPPPPSDPVAMLLARGDAAIAAGDIAEARLFYERAAASGSARAAEAIGKTYDPVFLARMNAIGIEADPATAAVWYRRAVALGAAGAASLLRVASR